MKYLVEREKNEIALADGLSVTFIRKEDNETYIDKMPGNSRILAVADGNVVVSHEGASVENAKAGAHVAVDGEGSAKIFGKFHGICLSAREDIACFTETIDIEKDRKTLKLPEETGGGHLVQTITACGGYAVVIFGSESLMLENGETLAIAFDSDETYDVGVMGEGRIIVGTFACAGTFEGVASDAGESAESADEAPEKDVSAKDKAKKLIKEKKAAKRKASLKGATFSDFVKAFKVSSTNHRFGQRFSRFRKENWLDPEITWEVDKLQRRHINAIIWVIVLVVIMAVVGLQVSFITFLIWAGIWTLIDLFIVAPFIYLLVMPKPVGSHIKKISELTEEEEKIRQKEINSDRVYHKKRVLNRY